MLKKPVGKTPPQPRQGQAPPTTREIAAKKELEKQAAAKRQSDVDRLADRIAMVLVDKIESTFAKSRPAAKQEPMSLPQDTAVESSPPTGITLDDESMERLLEAMREDDAFRGPAGLDGPAGPRGPRGPPGAPGESYDPQTLVAFDERLKAVENASFSVEIRMPDGTVQTGNVSVIGGELTIDFSGGE